MSIILYRTPAHAPDRIFQVQIIDKEVERLVETIRPVPVDKRVQRTVERIQVSVHHANPVANPVTPVDDSFISDAASQTAAFLFVRNLCECKESMLDKKSLCCQVVDNATVKEVPYMQTVVRVEERIVEVPIEKEIIKEFVQEVIVDKVVERIVEVIREVPVERIVQRRVEVIKEVPVVRYVDHKRDWLTQEIC